MTLNNPCKELAELESAPITESEISAMTDLIEKLRFESLVIYHLEKDTKYAPGIVIGRMLHDEGMSKVMQGEVVAAQQMARFDLRHVPEITRDDAMVMVAKSHDHRITYLRTHMVA